MKQYIRTVLMSNIIMLICPMLCFATSEGNTDVYLSVPASAEMIDEILPQTGDENIALPYILGVIFASIFLIALYVFKKGRKK